MRALKVSWRRVAMVVLGALALCWAAALNGQPFFHPDTQAYVRGPDVAVMSVLGERFATPWATHDPGAKAAPAAEGPGVIGPVHSFQDDEVIAGRSIYYGLLPYLGQVTGGFWLTVFLQALSVAWLAEIVLRAAGWPQERAYAATLAVLALLTPAPFFVGLLMPDIWAGLVIGSASALFALWGRMTRFDRYLLGKILIFGTMAHNSHVLVLGCLIVAATGWWLMRRRQGPDARPGLVLGVAALILAVGGSTAFGLMVAHRYGKPPITPPFLTARVIADGPGTRYVRAHCGQVPVDTRFEVCRYADRLPLEVDDFLWRGDAPHGVFETAPPQSRRRLSEEQTRFAASVLATYPVSQTLASLKNAALQTTRMDLEDFRYKPSVKATFEAQLPEPHRSRMERTLAARDAWPLSAFEAVQALAVLLSLAAIGWSFVQGRRRPELGEALLFTALALAGVLFNGAICGAFSALHGRYQARVAWLIPLCALILLTRLRGRWGGGPEAA